MKHYGFLNIKGAPVCKPQHQFVPAHEMANKSAERTYGTFLRKRILDGKAEISRTPKCPCQN